VALARIERDAFWERRGQGGDRARPLVAASIGSYGAFLADGSEYRGDWARWTRWPTGTGPGSHPWKRAARTSWRSRLPSLVEVEAIVRLLAETGGPPAWISVQARFRYPR
jgi:homocysteine S-methyltransferase